MRGGELGLTVREEANRQKHKGRRGGKAHTKGEGEASREAGTQSQVGECWSQKSKVSAGSALPSHFSRASCLPL